MFFGKKDAPYGYLIVDHANKTVIHGARVLAMDELLDFATPEERFERIENYIDQLLSLNPKITQGEIFQKLRKQRAYIKKGVIYFDGKSRPLKPFMAEAINRNNRIHYIEMFRPATVAERDLLCKIFKVDRPDLVDISTERPPTYADAAGKLRDIFPHLLVVCVEDMRAVPMHMNAFDFFCINISSYMRALINHQHALAVCLCLMRKDSAVQAGAHYQIIIHIAVLLYFNLLCR